MSHVSVFLIAFGLSMDAFAVSIGLGIKSVENKVKTAIRASLLFGLFQSLMPIMGWLLGNQFKYFISNYAHWAAFIILFLIGSKMLYESRKADCDNKNATGVHTLFLLAIATSIDALAVGVSFSFLSVSIIYPVIVIGLITFIVSFIGVELGNRLGCYARSKAEILGGVILIILGFKILLENIYFS